MSSLDLSKVPKERWAGALAMALLQYFERAPQALFDLVSDGEEAFVKNGKSTDRMGLQPEHYRECFKILRKRALRLGLDRRLLKHH